jgi:hypothetical protein
MNNKHNIISAQTNATNIDLIGKTLLSAVKSGQPLDLITTAMLVTLLSESRFYSTVRDWDSLTDETSKCFKDHLASLGETPEQDTPSVSEAADKIINDLRADGINL